MAAPTTFSLKEAATLARLPEGKVRREVEHRVIEPETVWVGRAPRRIFRDRDVYYLTFLAFLHDDVELSRSIRSRIYRKFANGSYGARSPAAHVGHAGEDDPEPPKLSDVVTFNYDAAVEAAARRIELYRRGKERVTSSEAVLGGEPVFAGTRLAVRHVGGMRLRGEPVARILEDYPYLSEEDVEFAALFAEANPPLGRPKAVDAAS